MADIYTTLRTLEDGQLADDLQRGLNELFGDLSNHAAESGGQAKGEATLKIKFALKDGVIGIENELTFKRPKPLRRRTVMWLDSQNNLTPKNPKQQELPLVDVNRRADAPRTA
jgi:hypothetical protein